MSKKELIQIRVSEDEKLNIKRIARKMGLTISEFLLYGAMKSISEYELLEIHYKNSQWNPGGDFKKFSLGEINSKYFFIKVYSFDNKSILYLLEK